MTHRISISEDTMRRLRELAANRHKFADEPGHPGNGKYGYTVEDLLCELLREAGF